MAQLLNLDELVEVKRQVEIKGTTYDVREGTVESWLTATKLAKELEKIGPEDQEKQMEATLELVSQAIPDCPMDVLRGLTFKQLNALQTFIATADEELVEQAQAQASDAAEGDAKK